MSTDEDGRDIALVGVCGSGKSTVVKLLRQRGYRIREIHQEHSYVPRMWRVIHKPDLLIYLDVSWEEAYRRRPHTSYGPDYHTELVHRLQDARAYADIYVLTDGLSPDGVVESIERQLSVLAGKNNSFPSPPNPLSHPRGEGEPNPPSPLVGEGDGRGGT